VNIPPNVGPNENYMGVVSRGFFRKLIVISKKLAKKIQTYARNSQFFSQKWAQILKIKIKIQN
jgi:hypothetical protein